MMGLAIKSALEERAVIYDFLRGDEAYKSLWACQERQLLRLELFPPSRRGAIYRQAMELRWNIKKISRAGAKAKQLTMNN
jgi:CelD/BcsL family acetyltransferase involved in cellulose biosynthesis